LAALELPETDLPPGIPTFNFTKVAPLLALASGVNATVLASWVPVIEKTPPESLALLVPAVNAIEPSTIEAVVAALPYMNLDTVVELLPLVNALPVSTLSGYLKLLGDVSGTQRAIVPQHKQRVSVTWLRVERCHLHLMHACESMPTRCHHSSVCCTQLPQS
jgi:hypothetical protein